MTDGGYIASRSGHQTRRRAVVSVKPFDNPGVHTHETRFSNPPIHQVVFYQSGIGTENLYDKIVDGEVSFNIV